MSSLLASASCEMHVCLSCATGALSNAFLYGPALVWSLHLKLPSALLLIALRSHHQCYVCRSLQR